MAPEDVREVGGLQREPHPEHYDDEQIIDPLRADKTHRRREKERDRRCEYDKERHPSAHERAQLFQNLHNPSPFCPRLISFTE